MRFVGVFLLVVLVLGFGVVLLLGRYGEKTRANVQTIYPPPRQTAEFLMD